MSGAVQHTHNELVEKPAETATSSKLSREEREDFIHSLEHIVTVGSSTRRAVKRAEEWNKKQESDQDTSVANLNEKDGELLPPQMMHAEDVRILGKANGHPQRNWPQKNRGHRSKDVEWDKEHGDCVHSLAFLEARLSDMPPSKRQRVDGPNLSMDKTDCRIALEEAPRAMLARCWERAVHAVSMSIGCKEGTGEEAELDSPQPVSSNTASPIDVNSKYSSDNAARKCQDLNIHIKASTAEKSCPQCGIVYDSDEDFRKHFFGREDHSQRGCCWAKIRTTQYQLLDQVLQQEVTESAEGLIKTVFSSLDNTDPREEQVAHDWQDVLSSLESGYGSANVREDSAHGMQDTMLLEPNKGPVALNAHVLQNTKLRLIDRYVDLPL